MRHATLALLALACACSTPREETAFPTELEVHELAEGVQWNSTVTVMRNGDMTEYQYVVERANGVLVRDETFTGTTTVPDGQTVTLNFPCDEDSAVFGYRLVLHGGGTFSGSPLVTGPKGGR